MDGSTTVATLVTYAGAVNFTVDNLSAGSHNMTAVYGGDTNFTSSTSNAVTKQIKVPSVHSLTSLSITPHESHYGESVAMTATVCCSGGPAGIPTGIVKFVEGTSILAVGTLVDQRATVSPTLAIGIHDVKAIYEGDATFIGSTSSVSRATVLKSATSTTLVSSPPPAQPYPAPYIGLFTSVQPLQPVTFTATVNGSAAALMPEGGTVTFMDDETSLGTAPLDASRHATLTTILSGGTHAFIRAVYNGDDTFSSSTSNVLIHEVSWGSFTAAFTTSAQSSPVGEPVTLTMTVQAQSPGYVPGTVKFSEVVGFSRVQLGEMSLNQGRATYTTASLGVGTHRIDAMYASGFNSDGSPQNGLSKSLTLDIIKRDTTTAVTAGPPVSVFGQPVTLTATVTASGGALGTPTGTLTFKDGPTAIATATLTSGQATYTTASLLPGIHAITAVYAGDDANFAGSTSGVITQTTNKGASTTTITSAANPSVPGQLVTFTVTVTAQAPAAGMPTGSVTFSEGTATLGTVTLTNGRATFNLSTLPVGTHLITASYAGDTHFTGGAAGLTQTVDTVGAAIGGIAERLPALDAGTRNSLSSQLTAAIQAAGRGQNTTTANILGAFVNKVSALVNSGRLTQSAANELVAPVNGLIAVLK
jgi:hypothetical protein